MEHFRLTIEALVAGITSDEQALSRRKASVNEICNIAGLPPHYAATELETVPGGASLSIRSDQFYGRPLNTCIREILELRRRLDRGPATVNEIYESMLEGGYKFNTATDRNAKISLAGTLSKSSKVFHQLPNKKWGLLEWYPKAKSKPATGAGDDAEEDLASDSEDPADPPLSPSSIEEFLNG